MKMDDLVAVWMRRWGTDLTKELTKERVPRRVFIRMFKHDRYANWIVDGTVANRWSDRAVELAVKKHKNPLEIYSLLKREERSKEDDFDITEHWTFFGLDGFNDRGSSGSRKPRKPKPSSGSGSAAKRLKRKKQFENNDQYYSASHGHRPRGRPTPMSGETCNSCGSPIRWDGNCNCT